jgi:predicted chitinase
MKFLILLLLCAFMANVSSQSCTSGFTNNPNDCGSYYVCNFGSWLQMSCPAGLQWNNGGKYCDWPASSGCTTGSAPTPNPNPNPGSSSGIISQSEFQCAAQTKEGNPDPTFYSGFTDSLPKAYITSKEEAAKFLAHSVWETVGFKYTKEVYCQSNDCSSAYPNQQGGLPGKVYYGRGMLQLTCDYNYKAASQDLYGDDRLLQKPDQVAEDPAVGWATAAWYWKDNVHDRAQTFGSTLKAINGALECDGGPNAGNRILRFNHYKDILTCLGMVHPPDSDGDCSAW